MSTTRLPPISVIVTTHEQCDALRSHLPAVLEQEYPAGFEVIVVDMNSTDDSLLFMEQLASRYPNLHAIKTPDSARDISPIRLALTLGIRAANNDWNVITTADCHPASSRWLARLGEACTSRANTQIVLGHTRYTGGKGWSGLRNRFFRIWQQTTNYAYAHRHGAYRADGTNLCYNRQLFLSHRGFADDTNLLMGATDIMVNRHSNRHNTVLCLTPEAHMLQDATGRSYRWTQERIFFMETRRHFRHHILYRMRYLASTALTWLVTLSAIAAVVGGLILRNHIAVAVAVALWLAFHIVQSLLFNRRLKAIGEKPFTLSQPLLRHLIPWWDLTAWLGWFLTKRQTFRKKYI